MPDPVRPARFEVRLIDQLYLEAMLLADEARSYFDQVGRDQRDMLDPLTKVAFSCESLKVTTRLMHVIAWLLTQRAVIAGELPRRDAMDPSRRLGESPVSDADVIERMPAPARTLIAASADLHRRVARLDAGQGEEAAVPASPAREMMERLRRAI